MKWSKKNETFIKVSNCIRFVKASPKMMYFFSISYINVQKSTDFKPQEKRERKTGHACSWGGGPGQIGRKKERKKERERKRERKME
jgi:hypothetical protein